MSRRLRLTAPSTLLAVVVALTLSGCGGSGSPVDQAATDPVGASAAPEVAFPTPVAGASPTDSATPDAASSSAASSTAAPQVALEDAPALPVTVVDETGAEITIKSIDRIIPLDGDLAEVVFALGLGDNVVATDLSATYPPEADALPEIGFQRALSAERVASFAPTVLLATDLAGPPEALDDMRRLGYPLVMLPNEATSTGAGQKIRATAAALGIPKRGEALAAALDAAIADASVPPDHGGSRPRVLTVYVRGTVAQLVLGEAFNTRWLINAAGGVDLSEFMGIDDSAPISAEAILAAAPDVLLVTSVGLETVGGIDGLLDIGGLGQTPAGQNRQVLTYDAQLLLGNGPRTAELLFQLREDLRGVIVNAPRDPENDS